jgi:glycosyltransferase involved in cell wall biosynthesis
MAERNSMKKVKLLYFANSYPWPGGQIVIFEQVYEDLSKTDEIDIKKISVNLMRSWKIVLSMLRVLYGFVLVPFYDVISLQASYNYLHFLGPLLYGWAKLWRKPFLVRTSAGNNIELYHERNRYFKKILDKTVFNADTFYLETKYQVKYFSYVSKNKVAYMPNNRRLINGEWTPKKEPAKKFVFLGGIDERKGAQMLIEAFSEVAEQYPVELDLIGHDSLGLKEKIKSAHVHIRAPFKPAQIYEVLSQYDVLVLPSYREGIPGVIIEAFMLDKPVITTYLPSIMEFMENEKHGLLIRVGNSEELKKAIIRMHQDIDLYNAISANIHQVKKEFDRARWSRVYADEVLRLAQKAKIKN